ncbi:hypothetical protein BG011_003888 [Mortierella polycephala]|uniref:Protein kinase domain-containing protein n=1 Tax=Mortierella polycephala TaxID=41804 RepID=A0A9P6Q3X5_9FUNG|nr:hypothetical protein BG011_003888 [Mortierella polycephala]
MTPSSGRSVETEMPSLAFSDGNSTSSHATHPARQSPRLGPPSPSPSLSPQVADSAESANGDYFLTSVLNMIAPTGIPPVAHYDYQSEFTQRQRIAKGGNGEIRRAYWPLRQCTVILKSLIDTKHTPAQIAKLFDKEVEVMNQCRQHDNIVQFYGVGIRDTDDERNGERFMIMQYYELGDLVKLLQTPQQSPEAPSLNDKLYLALDIAQGLEHLFQCGFHHGDLHPKNILIEHRRDRAPQQGRYQARLTDFGLRRIRDNKNAFSSQQFGGVWQFMAPERMSKNRPRYDVRCDIFALGVIYWFIMAGRYPFKDPSTFSPGAREGRVDGTPDWYYNVYTQAWSEDPNARQQNLGEIVQVFWHNLGIQAPTSQYLDPNYTRTQYASPSHGYEASMSSSMHSYEGQPHQDSGTSGGAFTIRGSPMLTPASMLTPTSLNGRASPHPPSPMLTNMAPQSASARRPSNANPSYYRQNLSPHVQHPPTDGISEIQFSSQADFLAASSWDNNVRIYEVQPNGSSVAKAMYSHAAPVLCCAWSKDGTKIASGGADKAGKVFDVSTGQSTQVALHDAPIREVRWVDGQSPILATGSWDKTIKYWDTRQQTPISTIALPERLYCMDSVFPLLVAGTADRHVLVYNLNNPATPFKAVTSPLKWQTRTISCFPNGKGYGIGSIEGRVAIQYVEDSDASFNFSFKCHREGGTNPREKAMVYSVNSINWHPIHHTFTTAGADGSFAFWDKDSRQKLKSFPKVGDPISTTCYNRNGTIFAYAVSYDWSKGYLGATPQNQNKIMLHAVNDIDVRPRKRT